MIGTASLHRLVELADAAGVATGPRRRPPPAPSRRPGRPVRRAVRHRPRPRARPHPPLPPPLGSRRLAPAARRRPSRARRLPGPRPDRRRPLRPTTSTASPSDWIELTGDRAHRGGHRQHQRARRRPQRRHPARPPRRRPPRPRPRPCRSPAVSGRIPGDVVATRRNDRQLRTSTGEPVRNRDRWTVTAVHVPTGRSPCPTTPDTAPSPSPPTTSASTCGSATPPPSTATKATPSTSASTSFHPATTHRGLYVGATRGRDDNRLHVVTETTDPAEARDVLDTRAGPRPGRHPRRHPTPRPRPPRPAGGTGPPPTPVLPDWVRPSSPARGTAARSWPATSTTEPTGRLEAAAELVALQPALAAARAAGSRTAKPSREIEDELRDELRPAMWKANHDALHAGFGHRHAATRRAKTATVTGQRRRSRHRHHPRRRRRHQQAPRHARSRPPGTSTTGPTRHPTATASKRSTATN